MLYNLVIQNRLNVGECHVLSFYKRDKYRLKYLAHVKCTIIMSSAFGLILFFSFLHKHYYLFQS